jgi:hypothetical protein
MSNFQSQSIPGYNGVFYVSTDGGTTWLPVGELQDVTLQIKTAMLDATSHSSNGWKNNVPGLKEWSASVGQLAIFSDTGQAALTAALTPGTRLKFRFDPAGTATGKPRREGFGLVSDWQEKEPTAALEDQNLTLTGDSELVFSTQ